MNHRFRSHPFVFRRPVKLSDVGSGTNYPLGFSLVQILRLFCDIQSLRVSGSAISVADSGINFRIDSIDSALAGLAVQNASGGSFSFSGESKRKLGFAGNLDKEDNCAINYPIFTLTGNNVGVTINLGKTVYLAGLFYPWISVILPEVSNTVGANVVGAMTFDSFGEIPLFSSNALFFEGRIVYGQEYSSIKCGTDSLKIGTPATFTAANCDLSKVKFICMGGSNHAATSTSGSTTFTPTANAKNGPVLFVEHEPNFNTFLSKFELTLTS